MARKNCSDFLDPVFLCWSDHGTRIEACLCKEDCSPFPKGSGSYGYIKASLDACGDWVVCDVGADDGWGPLLYELAMEHASIATDGLMSDRRHVTKEALDIWKVFNCRTDVVQKNAKDHMVSCSISVETDPDHPATKRDPTEAERGYLDRVYRSKATPLVDLKRAGRVIHCKCRDARSGM
jgi:hypothetical protein